MEKVVRLRMRVAIPRPLRRTGFFVSLLCSAVSADAGHVQVRLVESPSLLPVPGVSVSARAVVDGSRRFCVSDDEGVCDLSSLTIGDWIVEARSIAHRDISRPIRVTESPVTVDLQLSALPLKMDEVVVRARADVVRAPAGAVVEQIPLQQRAPSADVPQILQQAAGVDVRRYGGLGAFSSLSIRGSTSEQVQIFLDGVPLNAAAGGGVDLGRVPMGGLETIDVYRGAVPGRFGGNSLGGVVHLRSRPPGGQPRMRLHSQAGSFATRQVSGSVSGRHRQWDGLLLLDHAASDNDFRFFDDNGTQYNLTDDEWTRRRNSDFTSWRGLARIARPVASARLQLSLVADEAQRGLPGIGNYQAHHTRLDSRRTIAEANLYGPLADGALAVRLRGFHSDERVDYRDLQGEVGLGAQHERTHTTSTGLRLEGSRLISGWLGTLFTGLRRERFEPESLLGAGDDAPPSLRWHSSLGVELEPASWRRLSIHVGGQVERLLDDLATDDDDIHSQERVFLGGRLGATLALDDRWTLRAHIGRYSRAPGFLELFGDRGFVQGNADLDSESGRNSDVGLVYQRADAAFVSLLEVTAYDNDVDDLIRFLQNSQRVSRPHNIGRAHLRGIETRANGSIFRRYTWAVGYTWQHAENQSPFTFERGNDLPNTPRHRLHARVSAMLAGVTVASESNHESRHFLDRANLQPIPARTVHTASLRWKIREAFALSGEVRNLTDNQVADLWGYPLPGRAYFLSLDFNHEWSQP